MATGVSCQADKHVGCFSNTRVLQMATSFHLGFPYCTHVAVLLCAHATCHKNRRLIVPRYPVGIGRTDQLSNQMQKVLRKSTSYVKSGDDVVSRIGKYIPSCKEGSYHATTPSRGRRKIRTVHFAASDPDIPGDLHAEIRRSRDP